MQRLRTVRPHCTKTGRIVYDRKKHEFNIRDVFRICKKINHVESIEEYKVLIALAIKVVSLLTVDFRRLLAGTPGYYIIGEIKQVAYSLLVLLFEVLPLSDNAKQKFSEFFSFFMSL